MERYRAGNVPLFAALAVLGLLGFIACSSGTEGAGQDPSPAVPPGPSANHALHVLNELACMDCHDPEETGEQKLPQAETCFACHELEDEGGAVRSYFDAIRRGDGSYEFPGLSYDAGLVFGHKSHGEYTECSDCHGEPKETRFGRPLPMALKQNCQSCHLVNDAPMECATCHKDYRRDVAPKTHTSGFLKNHGAVAPAGWREGGVSSCSQCHEVPRNCNECHTATKPQGHLEAGFEQNHGTGDTDALDYENFEETSCALCHDKQESCINCHLVERPRGHTNTFTRRTHGLVAGIERQSCLVCHKQDFCTFCHLNTEPVSHRGAWDQAHCVTCHDPLPQSGCFSCHKNTIGHLSATPLPPGLPHSAATDCRTCHTVIPHFDDGGNCRRCHR